MKIYQLTTLGWFGDLILVPFPSRGTADQIICDELILENN